MIASWQEIKMRESKRCGDCVHVTPDKKYCTAPVPIGALQAMEEYNYYGNTTADNPDADDCDCYEARHDH